MTRTLTSPPQNLLICRTDKLGDTILALPSLLLAKTMFPDCKVTLLVQPYTAELVQYVTAVRSLILCDPDSGVRELTAIIKEGNFDAAIVLYPEYRIARALQQAGVPLRAGIAYRWYSWLFNVRHREHRKHNIRHEVDYNLNLVYHALQGEGCWEDVLQPEELFPLKLFFPAEVHARVVEIIGKRPTDQGKAIVLHPGGGGSAHRWPVDRYCELARELNANPAHRLFVTGVDDEKEICAQVTAAAGSAAENLCGQLSLIELAALLKGSDLLVTNSTGPLHLARAVDCPVLGLFPGEHAMSPVRWGPYGQPQNVLQPPVAQGMESIGVDAVMTKIEQLLE